MQHMSDYSSSISSEQVAEAYLKVIRLIDDRVTPFLGKVTTRVLVQGAARRVSNTYPFLHFLVKMPYTDVVPAVTRAIQWSYPPPTGCRLRCLVTRMLRRPERTDRRSYRATTIR